jgi:hypothetical protein
VILGVLGTVFGLLPVAFPVSGLLGGGGLVLGLVAPPPGTPHTATVERAAGAEPDRFRRRAIRRATPSTLEPSIRVRAGTSTPGARSRLHRKTVDAVPARRSEALQRAREARVSAAWSPINITLTSE